jgi:LytS/YehU family sensor histidine kinase
MDFTQTIQNTTVLTGVVILLVFVVLYLIIRLLKSEKKKTTIESKYNNLELKINNLQLETIESKLNPHLFKNILNSVQSHAYQTYFALDKLAGVLDYILYESRKKLVTPKEEIEFALNLVEINKIKISPLFELKIKTKINESEPLFEQKVLAPMISVDLIENAFKHADLQSPDAFISIVFEFKKNVFNLTVANKISQKPPIKKEKSGIGSQTLEQRLNLIYRDCFELNKVVEDNVFIASLKINLLEYKTKMLTAGR